MDTNSGFDLESPLPFAYGTFGPRSDAGSVTSGGENNMLNPFYNNNNNNNASYAASTSGLLSPSFSRKSRSCGMTRGTRCSIPQRNTDIFVNEKKFLSISKYVIGYLTLMCCILFANITQMIVLYNVLADHNQKYILIYVIFPFLLFIFLKINDIILCNEIRYLFNFGYVPTPMILNRNRQIIHFLTFIGFPFLWIIYLVINSDWVQSIDSMQILIIKKQIIHSVLITIWTIIQFIQFLLCIISLLYCIQHNIHQQPPNHKKHNNNNNNNNNKKYLFSITNPFNHCTNNNNNNNQNENKIQAIERYMHKIQLLENQISSLQRDLIKSRHENIAVNSALSTEFAEEIQEKNQDFRALLSEKELLKTELENKKSLLNMKKQQCKQQLSSIKSLQQIREENIQTINELKRKLNVQKQEMQKMQILLQIERQNAQQVQQYFENFT